MGLIAWGGDMATGAMPRWEDGVQWRPKLRMAAAGLVCTLLWMAAEDERKSRSDGTL